MSPLWSTANVIEDQPVAVSWLYFLSKLYQLHFSKVVENHGAVLLSTETFKWVVANLCRLIRVST